MMLNAGANIDAMPIQHMGSVTPQGAATAIGFELDLDAGINDGTREAPTDPMPAPPADHDPQLMGALTR